ncbi:nucleoside hydrolase [Microterricola viridarii]|uniref:Inosine/uridine-preferring nucleoside hydrolase domain-containing protein n=1 Tax=Microterricola viridarii TaxID=412690 RepID=A0A0X8E3P8_9MICO|nr:nucleoside hydrolase [Microterricola viridarii]AMB58421.1 hypothetical protein AWU67_05645 [Microterricola viridarii]
MTHDQPTDIRHVIVDTDTGIDDALALLYLAAQPNVEISAITSVYGNTPVEDAVTNIARVLKVVGLEQTLVARGAAGPILGEPRIAEHVHGTDGLGDIWGRSWSRSISRRSAPRSCWWRWHEHGPDTTTCCRSAH